MSTSSAPPSPSYPLLLRSQPEHRWWRPLLVGLVAAALYAAVALVVMVAVVVAGLTHPSFAATVERGWSDTVDFGDPTTFALLLASVVLTLPALLVAQRLVAPRQAGLLSSVAGRLRWRWLGTATLLALAVCVPTMTVWVLVEAAAGTLEVRAVPPATVVALLVVTLVLVPFQAAAEEYVFRGHLAQLVGSWLRHPALAVLLPVPLFVAGHGYGTLGAIDVGVFAVVCGWLAWRTGGLEAPIALHVANNVVLMSLTAVGLGDPNATDTDLVGLAVSVATMGLVALLLVRRADALGIARTRSATAGGDGAGRSLTSCASQPTPVDGALLKHGGDGANRP